MDRKVSVAYLKVGMYVSKLDRAWVQTPFLIQGFLIRDEEEIYTLVKHCTYVYIDIDKGIKADMYFDTVSGPTAYVQQKLATNKRVEQIINTGVKNIDYIDKSSTVEELPQAKAAFSKAALCVGKLIENDFKEGKLNIAAVKNAVAPILDSMIRNTDAFMWLSKMEKYDSYSYEHAVQNCALGIAFGRHLGMKKVELNTLATGLLLMDIGKMHVPKELLYKESPLTEDESEVMRKHVAFTVELLRKTEGINEHVINIALTHHERYDGSGYPNGLVGVQTPVYGRLAGIIDCYDTLITSTPLREGVPEHKALQDIYNQRDKSFQKELVEQFMQCMGVYPTGSLVELSTGSVGAVLSQNVEQKLKPKVIMLLDENKRPYSKRCVFDLSKQEKMAVHISKSLENLSYGVDVKQIGI